MRVVGFEAEALSVPLHEPFVIATGTMTATRSLLVRVRIARSEGTGEWAGIGEAAALPPVTDCDQPDLVTAANDARGALATLTWTTTGDLAGQLADRIPSPVLRAGIEAALLDAWAHAENTSVAALIGGTAPTATRFVSDITLPIAEPAHMAELARGYASRGFDSFKVKVGRSLEADAAALMGIAAAVPNARFRIDANGGYREHEARALLDRTRSLTIECFEQPCAREDFDGLVAVQRATNIPVVADESLRSPADLARLVETGAVRGVNLKLMKLGSLVTALAVGRAARSAGLGIMCGAMVETRLGLAAMLHVAGALGGADWIDLDTQLLLTREAFAGGYDHDGPRMTLDEGLGLGVREVI